MSKNMNTMLINIEKNSLIESMNLNLTIDMKSEITTIIILNNNKDIAICLANGLLYVYEIKTFQKKLEIKLTDKTILDIVEFENNKACISCWDNKIRFIQFYNHYTQYKIIQELIGHNSKYINGLKKSSFFKDQIILFSCSNDGCVILWKYDKENNLFNLFQKFKIYEIEHMDMNEDFQIEALEETIKYKKLICASSIKRGVYFCDLTNYSFIETINLDVNRCIRALKVINNDDILLVAGYMKIYVLNIKDKLVLQCISFNTICEFNCIFQKRDGNILISEYTSIEPFSKMNEYNFNRETLELLLVSSRKNDFKSYITTIVETSDNHLMFGGYNCEIKVFK